MSASTASRAESHGKFRGSPESFEPTVKTMRELGERGLLKGVLVTPNRLAALEEYEELCRFARECGAEYVLMNPLSGLGRGVGGDQEAGRTGGVHAGAGRRDRDL